MPSIRIPRRSPAVPRSLAWLALVLVAVAGVPAAAQAASVLDQSSEDASVRYVLGGLPSESIWNVAQTFTAGASGPLDAVDLHLGQPETMSAVITVEIRPVDGAGAPTNEVLATSTIPASSVPNPAAFVRATFAAPTDVVAGTQYALVAYTAGRYTFSASAEGVDSYAAGAAFLSHETPPVSWVRVEPAVDLAFRTFVTSNAPPVAMADSYNMVGGATLTVPASSGVLANDTDTDAGTTLTAQQVSPTSRGALVLNADGSFQYTPSEDTVGADTFTYRAYDGTAYSNPATVTINVQAGCEGRRATQVGTPGRDVLGGSGGNDVILALGGSDVINSGSGNDVICGGSGNDRVEAGSGNDVVRGGTGDDVLDGGSGDDRLFGEAGIDRLRGGGDDDALDGGAGSSDRCDGDGGRDAAARCETVLSVP